MTGKGILEALSFVDETYIEEAERGTLRRTKPIVKALLPLAACFCLALAGLFMTDQVSPSEQMVSGQEPAVGIPETVYLEKSESVMYGQNDIAPEMQAPELIEDCDVPSVILRIVQWTEEGFTATVEKIVDTDIFPVGTLLNVEIMANIYVETYSGDLVMVERRMPTEAEFPAGTVVLVQFHHSPEEENTICIDIISREEE